jgi:hypothetical protein
LDIINENGIAAILAKKEASLTSIPIHSTAKMIPTLENSNNGKYVNGNNMNFIIVGLDLYVKYVCNKKDPR